MSQLDQLEPKDPDDVKDYGIRWSRHLVADVIASSTWIIPATPTGLTKDSDSFNAVLATTTAWFSGGTVDIDYLVTNRITTTGGRTLDQTITIRVRSR